MAKKSMIEREKKRIKLAKNNLIAKIPANKLIHNAV